MKKKILAFLLSIFMLVGLFPTVSFATEVSETTISCFFAADNPTMETAYSLNALMPIREVSVNYFSIKDLATAAGITPTFNETANQITAAHVAIKAVRDEFNNQQINPFDKQYSDYITMQADGKITSLCGSALAVDETVSASSLTGTTYNSCFINDCAPSAPVYNPTLVAVKDGALVLISRNTINKKSNVNNYINYFDAYYKATDANNTVSLSHSQYSSTKLAKQPKNTTTYVHNVYFLNTTSGKYENVTGNSEYYIAPTNGVGGTAVDSIDFQFEFKKDGQYAVHTYNAKSASYIAPGSWCIINCNATVVIDQAKLQMLSALISSIESGYYQTGDRWNGLTYSESGFWTDAQLADKLITAKQVAQRPTSTTEINNSISTLNNSIHSLIPITQANTTVLYEQLHTKNYWNTDGKLVQNPPYMQTGYVVPSADNCTASTWSAYAAAKAEGQALMDSLFDKEGNATTANTVDKQAKVERLAAAADPHTLVNAERYNKAYQTYRSRETEVNSLLSVYDPAKLKASDYTEASWNTYETAYAALKQDMEHTIVGGTKADMEMLEGFTGHIEALKTARKGLVSGVNITVSFRYVNNFAAKYSQSGQSGTTAYENPALSLESGKTSVADAIQAAKIAFNKTNANLPCDNYNLSDINPMIAVYINGESYGLGHISGGKLEDIQLHAGDDVRLARVCQPIIKTEASSGYDSTQIFEYLANNETDYQDSYALIDMTAPAGTVKVGDKAEFTAKVIGASASKLGKALDAENVTLFISAPANSETLTEPTKQTTAATDSSGRLQYIFTEPGWYTVAMHNVQDDVPTFTDVYNATTIGQYYNLYAGDYALLYVAPADDEAALMAQYRRKPALSGSTITISRRATMTVPSNPPMTRWKAI